MKRVNCHPAASDVDSAPESIAIPKECLDRNGDLDNRNMSDYDWEADNESHIELRNGIQAMGSPEDWDVSAAPNVPGLIQPTWRSMKQPEQGFLRVITIERRRNMGNKNK